MNSSSHLRVTSATTTLGSHGNFSSYSAPWGFCVFAGHGQPAVTCQHGKMSHVQGRASSVVEGVGIFRCRVAVEIYSQFCRKRSLGQMCERKGRVACIMQPAHSFIATSAGNASMKLQSGLWHDEDIRVRLGMGMKRFCFFVVCFLCS